MLVIRVEFHDDKTFTKKEIARMVISNVGGTDKKGKYRVSVYRGRTRNSLDAGILGRAGTVLDYPSTRLHVWHLVCEALHGLGYLTRSTNRMGGDLEEIQELRDV